MQTIKKNFQRRKAFGHGTNCRYAAVMLILCLTLGFMLTPIKAQAAEDYTNPETGYQAVIEDDADLLTDSEETALLENMKPITAYGNVMFLSTSINSDTALNYAKRQYQSLFGRASGTALVIDMATRTISIYSDGEVNKTITAAYANTITDNIYSYASDRDYYTCAATAYEQELTLLEGGRIAQPMKYICNALLSVVLAILLTFALLSVMRKNDRPVRKVAAATARVSTVIAARQLLKTRTYYVSESSSSGGGGGGGGGGSGGSHSF